MSDLKELPNISTVLAGKLEAVGINSAAELREIGAKNAIIRINTLENGAACLNMLYALEGACQGIRWHGLEKETKNELKSFLKSIV